MTGTGISVEFAAAEPERLARWWAHVLGWELAGALAVLPRGPGLPLRFVAADRAKTGKNRVHLDLRSESHEHQQDFLLRLFNAGARFVDIGQGEDVPWQVLADPAGNELCLLEPRRSDVDTGPVHSVVVESADPAAESAAYDLPAVLHRPDLVVLHSPQRTGPYLEFVPGGATGDVVRLVPAS